MRVSARNLGVPSSSPPARRTTPGGLNAVVALGLQTLLLVWRGYANPAVRACPAPVFEVARGLWAETLSALLLPIGEARRELGELVAVANDPGDLQIRECRALASALLWWLTREQGHAPRFARWLSFPVNPLSSRGGVWP
jgi:hypothetical protein